MEYYNKELCVTFDELTSGDDPVMKVGTLKSLRHRDRLRVACRAGGEGTCALFVYSSLPAKYKARYVAKYGEPDVALRRERLRDELVLDGAAREWFGAFEYDLNGVQTHLKDELIDEYVLNASVLGVLLGLHERMEVERRMRGNPRRDLWPSVQAHCEELREVWPHTLPASLSRLKEKLRLFRKEGYASLVSKKLGNSNTLKMTDEAQRLLIALKRSRVPVYTDRQLMDEFNRQAERRGWKAIKSLSGLRTWLKRGDIEPLWYDAVYGEQAARLRFDRRHRTKLPELRDALWYGDGTKLNLYYQDEHGRVATIGVYEIVDAATEVLLGYHIAQSESHIAQYHALRMAIGRSGHKPYEIVTDNQGGHKKLSSQGIFSKVAVTHRPTAPYNGRSKTIESIFGRFQAEVLHQRWNFTGQNITTKKENSRPNLEFVTANARELPTLRELMADYAAAREEWNSLPHPATGVSRLEMYESMDNPLSPAVSEAEFRDMFWLRSEKPSTFTASGIEITIRGKKYAYEVFTADGMPDLAWRRVHTGERFVVQYDPCDLTMVRLYTLDGRFARVAKPYMAIARARQDQTEVDTSFIYDMRQAVEQERVERLVAARTIEQEHGYAPEQHGLRSPAPLGMSRERRDELLRRTALYRLGKQPPQTLGQSTKMQSNEDWMNIAGLTPEEQYQKTVGKL